MNKTALRIISFVTALSMIILCSGASLFVFADDSTADPVIETVFIGVDEKETGSSFAADSEKEISINSGDSLKLITVVKPETAADKISATQWRSEDERVAAVDENGVVTTGKSTTFAFRYLQLTASFKIPVGIRFFGVTRIYMTVTDNNGEVFYETVDLTVNHTFLDYINWFFSAN